MLAPLKNFRFLSLASALGMVTSSSGQTIVIPITPVTIADTQVVSFNLNPSGPASDSINDVVITVQDFGTFAYVASQGIGVNQIALNSGPAPAPAVRFGAAALIGSSETYGASSASGNSSVLGGSLGGNWSAGEFGYMGVEFDISGETHYGFLGLTWLPDDSSGSTELSTAVVSVFGYNQTPGEAAVTPVPEPSVTLLGSFLALAVLRRRRVS